MNRAVPLLVLAALLAGCSEAPPAEPKEGDGGTPGPAAGMRIEGIVQDLGFVPIEGATVAIRGLGLAETTGPDGRFAFPPVEEALHTVDAAAEGFEPATLLAQPTGGLVGLDFQLTRMAVAEPRNETVQYKGTLQCAFEALIISPSCDSALVAGNDELERLGYGRPLPEPFEQDSTFDFGVEPGWRTLVVDVAFDPASSPLLDGLRISFLGPNATTGFGTYEVYGRFHGAESFTARIEPNGTYPEGDGPVPAAATDFRVEVYPQSHAWHATCGVRCLLGAGAGLDVQFQVLVTAFYVEPAPEGWTLLDGA